MNYILNGNNWIPQDPFTPGILYLLGQHLLITLLAVGLGILVAVPLALLALRYERVYLPLVTTSSIIYTLPSLALIPLLVPVTGFGFNTVLIPLIAYTQVVLIRNIVIAVRGVDPALIEVGRAMGMNARQIQLRVIVPLALPVIVAGVRVVTVTTIGIATFGWVVGAENLGFLIYQGFNLSRTDMVAAGGILVSVFAIVVDLGLLVLERSLQPGRSLHLARFLGAAVPARAIDAAAGR